MIYTARPTLATITNFEKALLNGAIYGAITGWLLKQIYLQTNILQILYVFIPELFKLSHTYHAGAASNQPWLPFLLPQYNG